ncbi:MAG: RNA 2',3'-cyclic phosphodiesterase [Nitrospira sp.]|nr:RNA 2',3'-cyclic phosphodiesterase [Nitrospira sp.]
MIRAFLAVEIGDELRAGLARVQHDIKQRFVNQCTKAVRVTWGQPNSFHLTVRFLGDTDEQRLPVMREAVDSINQSIPTVEIPIERFQAFPTLQKPRVLWVGPSEEWLQSAAANQLSAWHQRIESCCRSFGFAPDDKRFIPHLALARIKMGERQVGQLLAQSGVCDRPLALGAIGVESLVLMKSDLRPAGPRYTKVWEVKLGCRS